MEDGSKVFKLPTLTKKSNRINATIKKTPRDFIVKEIPLYEVSGEGPHLYFTLKKRNLTTNQALSILSDHLNVSASKFGVPGRKDKRAVTTQRISLEHAAPDDFNTFDHPNISIDIIDYHCNKLQPGHLAGNKFEIILRGLEPTPSEKQLKSTFDKLRELGVPNFFGSQRFGRRQDTARLGEYMVHDRLNKFIELYFGKPRDDDPIQCQQARRYFEKGEHERAMDCWPEEYKNVRRGLAAYLDRGKPGPVLSAISKSRRQLFLSAYQSQIFNEILNLRLPDIQKIYDGDIAKKTDTGGLFEVEDSLREQPRADSFKISPTGLMPGFDHWKASGKTGDIEDKILEEHNLVTGKFEKVSYLKSQGDRRPVRFRIEGLEWKLDQNKKNYLYLSFTIPSGCYATVLLRELVLMNG